MRTKIIYEDDCIIVCHKLPGVPVQSKSVAVMDMESELKKYMKSKGEEPYIGVVHRLDQPVQGIMVFAKNKQAAASLSKQVSEHGDMAKIYEAIVYGHMSEASGELNDYLIKDGKTNLSKVTLNKSEGKMAKLKYETIEIDDETTSLKVQLFTGRHHQIRVQLAHAGCPILGDQKYGTQESMEFSKTNAIRNVALRAISLTFKHPKTGETMEFHLD